MWWEKKNGIRRYVSGKLQPAVKPLLAEEIPVHTVWYQKLISGVMECYSLPIDNTSLLRRRYFKEGEGEWPKGDWESGVSAASHGEFNWREEPYVGVIVAEEELEKGSREVQWKPSGWWMGWDFMDGTVSRATWFEELFWRQLSPTTWRREGCVRQSWYVICW